MNQKKKQWAAVAVLIHLAAACSAVQPRANQEQPDSKGEQISRALNSTAEEIRGKIRETLDSIRVIVIWPKWIRPRSRNTKNGGQVRTRGED